MKGPVSLNSLIREFKNLPGIGQKTAERLAFYILKTEKSNAKALADAIYRVKDKVALCTVCSCITEENPCGICNDSKRDNKVICVVEDPHDVFAIEKTKDFNGKYHVLMGALSPIDGVGPSDLRINELIKRVSDENIEEVIVATNPNTPGEATSMYLAKVLKHLNAKVTRIARGLPIGGDLEYADEVTLAKSFQGRQEI